MFLVPDSVASKQNCQLSRGLTAAYIRPVYTSYNVIAGSVNRGLVEPTLDTFWMRWSQQLACRGKREAVIVSYNS